MPWPEDFSTERLFAERLRAEHWDAIHQMHQDPIQMATLGGLRSADETSAYLARNLTHWDDFGFGIWLLRDRASQDIAGRALLRHLMLDEIDEVEVGYSLHPSFWGRGLATEIAGACVAHGRAILGMPSIVALTLPDNHRSQRVMTKIGMRLERSFDHDGHPHVLFRTE